MSDEHEKKSRNFDVVRVGVAALIYDAQDRLLIGLRKSPHGRGNWSFPGGHLEKGETPEECMKRELFEETGISGIEDPRFVGITNDSFASGKHYVTIMYEADLPPGAVPRACEPDKLERWEWHSASAFPEPLFLPIVNLLGSSFAANLRGVSGEKLL